MVTGKKVIVIGAGICGPLLAVLLKKKGALVEIYEAREEDMLQESAFLGLTPNGLNILKGVVDLNKLKADSTPGAMEFYNAKGKLIALSPTVQQKARYGVESFQLKRSALNESLRNAARDAGVPVQYGKRLAGLVQGSQSIVADFTDGSSVSGDLLMGCDGIFSNVRRQLFLEDKALRYTKIISTGGYARLGKMSKPLDAIRMTFGERGFFAYTVSNKGEIWWFNNYWREEEPKKSELESTLKDEIRSHLLQVHRNDDPLFSEVIRQSREIIAYPVYDIPKLPCWFKGSVCLLGDAAHGISPHVGQGASLAMEDCLVLAHLLDLETDPGAAFAEFERQRKPRVERIVRASQKVGNAKSKVSPIAAWFRDKLIGYFIKRQIGRQDWLYGWKFPDA